MKVGFEESNEKEFFEFLDWYKNNIGTYTESNFVDKKQYKNKNDRRIAYYVIGKSKYMIAEDLYTDFYHSFYDK